MVDIIGFVFYLADKKRIALPEKTTREDILKEWRKYCILQKEKNDKQKRSC